MTEFVDVATLLADEIEDEERRDPQAFYRAKLVSVRRMRAHGFLDEEIERLLGITLAPEDRSPKD